MSQVENPVDQLKKQSPLIFIRGDCFFNWQSFGEMKPEEEFLFI